MLGAWSYESYLAKIVAEAGSVADAGLPTWDSVEIQYANPGIVDHARWNGLQKGRYERSIFRVLDASYTSWGKVYGSDEPYTYETLWSTRIHYKMLYETSKKLIAVLRHYGCTEQDTGLGCDSGGYIAGK